MAMMLAVTLSPSIRDSLSQCEIEWVLRGTKVRPGRRSYASVSSPGKRAVGLTADHPTVSAINHGPILICLQT